MRVTPHPSKPLIWWYHRRHLIDMSPPYQRRGRLWSPSDKAYLIDSIINGFDVPKLYLADFQLGQSPLNTAKMTYAIIDGKQRLEAIFDFFDGKLVLNEDFIFRADRKLRLGQFSMKDLRTTHSSIAETFESETVDVMSVVSDNTDEINELFVRLNRSKPLTGAEIRNAMVGPVPEVVRNLVSHQFFQDICAFSKTRANDANAAAKVFLFEVSRRPVGTKKSDLDDFFYNPEHDRSDLELAARRALDTLDRMQEIFLPADHLLRSAGPVPAYYWFIRDLNSEETLEVRQFLVEFERARGLSRQGQLTFAYEHMDSLIRKYDAYMRSVNDSSSHTIRANLLSEIFRNWLADRNYLYFSSFKPD
jgi:hypothetical protein